MRYPRKRGWLSAVLSGVRDVFLEGGLAALKQHTKDLRSGCAGEGAQVGKRLVGHLTDRAGASGNAHCLLQGVAPFSQTEIKFVSRTRSISAQHVHSRARGVSAFGCGPLYSLRPAGKCQPAGTPYLPGPQAGPTERGVGQPGPRGAGQGRGTGVLRQGLLQGMDLLAPCGNLRLKGAGVAEKWTADYSPHRSGSHPAPRTHDGAMIPNALNWIWSTDITQAKSRKEGVVTVFSHRLLRRGREQHSRCLAERDLKLWSPSTRGFGNHYGPLAKDIAEGLILRRDHSSQYISHAFQQEITFLGIESSSSFA